MKKEREKQLSEGLQRFLAVYMGVSDICYQCGARISGMKKIGRSVYASCGCRMWQGDVPAAWRK